MEEMMEDTLQMDDDEELEAEADEEVEKVLFELTDGKLGQAGKVDEGLPVRRLLQHNWLCMTYHITRPWRRVSRRKRPNG